MKTPQNTATPQAANGPGNAAFNELLHAWLAHEDLRSQRASIATLADSRRNLDGLRLRAQQAAH